MVRLWHAYGTPSALHTKSGKPMARLVRAYGTRMARGACRRALHGRMVRIWHVYSTPSARTHSRWAKAKSSEHA